MDNPYNYHLPVHQDAMFFGRDRLLAYLVDGLTQSLPISAAVFGGRRIGKTSLLRKLERTLCQRGAGSDGRALIPWFYDPQAGYPIASSEDFFLLILDGFQGMLDRPRIPYSSLCESYRSVRHLGPVRAFEESFAMLLDGVAARVRLVILIDEAEILLEAPWGADLRPNLRNLLSNSGIVDKVALVMAGSTGFYSQVVEKDSPLENILTRYSLSSLTEDQSLALAVEPSRGRLGEQVAREVWRQSGGHPCLIQYVMHTLWDVLPEAMIEDVLDAASSFTQRLHHFESWSATLSSLAHQVYGWLAEQEQGSGYGDVRRRFAAADGSALQRALDMLAYHGLIDITGRGRRTQYMALGQMFREWYTRDRPLASHMTPSLPVGEEPPIAHAQFDVALMSRERGRLEVQVLDSPVGSMRGIEVAFDPQTSQLRAMLERIEIGDTDTALLIEVGQRLHDVLFPDQVWAAYLASLEAARSRDRGLCMRLRMHQPSLIALPWELLYERQEERFLALSALTPLVRTLPGISGSPLPEVPAPRRLLIASAAPVDRPALDIERERDEVLAALAPLIASGQVQAQTLDHATPAALSAALEQDVHWLHWIGHGEPDDMRAAALVLEREDGTSETLDVQTLRHLLLEGRAQPGQRLRLAFVNACSSARVGRSPGTRGLAQTLIRAGVPTAIGMGRPIADASARAFSVGFFGALARKKWPPYLAVCEGRRQVMTEAGLHSGDWAVPVLFARDVGDWT